MRVLPKHSEAKLPAMCVPSLKLPSYNKNRVRKQSFGTEMTLHHSILLMTRPTSMTILLAKCTNLRGCEMVNFRLKSLKLWNHVFQTVHIHLICPFKRKHHLAKVISPVTADVHVVVKLFGGITGSFLSLFKVSWKCTISEKLAC